MAPKTTSVSTLSAWTCPRCASRSFSSSRRRTIVGPEHPLYVDVPEPPQQTIPYRPAIKGVLPVPRNIFSGTSKNIASDEAIALSTKRALRPRVLARGSREEWKVKMADMRRDNLREGLKSLRTRQTKTLKYLNERSAAQHAIREDLLHKPEREDERITAPSHGLDLQSLLKGSVSDPTREERLSIKARNLANRQAAKSAERLDALHTLYMNARDFIVTPQQLDEAVDAAFGTPKHPVLFGGFNNDMGFENTGSPSIWAEGRPKTVQDMLNQANRQGTRTALAGAGYTEINRERLRRIAETLTGGKMDEAQR